MGISVGIAAILAAHIYPGTLMKLRTTLLLVAIAGLLSACQNVSTMEAEKLTQQQVIEQREKVLKMADTALAKLYAANPDVRKEIQQASGYGVFDVTSINAVLLVGAKGPGVIFDNKTKKPTFMTSVRAGTGPGVGYQELYQIFIFNSKEALDQFKVGDKVGGDLMASATVGTDSMQISANPYIKVYVLSEKGYAVQANYGGAAYMVDPNLN
jgi:lipid-binding SYLF domain-containing protein